MMLSELLPQMIDSDIDVAVSGLSEDSRQIHKGDVFCAALGEHTDGGKFIADAVERGAVAVIREANDELRSDNDEQFGVPIVAVESLRSKLGSIAGRFYRNPSLNLDIVAVTGTNGKTSFTQLLAQALNHQGVRCGVVGTMGHGLPEQLVEPGLTTPPAIDMQRRLASLRDEGCSAVVLEASSHGLAQHRLNGVNIETAVFTNLTRDHLDYHKSFEDYLAAKQQLFVCETVRNAVINLDDKHAAAFVDVVSPETRVLTYGVDPRAEVFCDRIDYTIHGVAVQVRTPDGFVKAKVPLFGLFNVQNLLAVIATLHNQGLAAEEIEASISRLKPIAGRMEVVRRAGTPTIIIDYAHTPDALEKSLNATRSHFSSGELSCVFGCGGDRDTGKRPIMGGIASRLADHVIVTSDNPRSEDPLEIIEEVAAGVDGDHYAIVDRAEAIRLAIESAGQNDVILIAGKGHEDYQELAHGREFFSDFEVVELVLSELTDGKGE